MLLWTTLGVGAGLVAAFALSGWVGNVNRVRVGRVARRLREIQPTRLTIAASAHAVEVALRAEPRLAGMKIDALPVGRGVVELRGWVPSRLARTAAGRTRARRRGHRERHQQHPGTRRGRPVAGRGHAGDRSERMTEPLAPQYDPSQIEAPLYTWWQERGLFRPEAMGPEAEPYVIVMPPPNVTAELHVGHGLNNTVQDVLIRFERMRGRAALWIPGTDHAGIATQNVVERLLAKEGKTRFDLGREAFVERVWEYVNRTGARILEQLKAIGCSADWSRTYFTLDPDLSRAVREVFVQLYEEGLVYRGHYIINWCPRCLTALSDEEAEKEETDGSLWHLRYPLADGSGHLTVATTRPETMLGDVAVAVHPEDERYRHLIGRELRLPVVDRPIPIIADDAVDPQFGSGAVKVTPAHDPTDFEIGRRHGLPSIDVMTPEARMSLAAPDRYQGLDRYDARKRVVEEFEQLGLLEKVEPHRHAVGHCYRCDTVIEPRLSEQWFVKMEPLARRRARQVPRRHAAVHPRAPRGRLRALAHGYPRLVHLPPALVGPPHPGLVLCADRCAQLTVSRTDVDACPACGGAVRQDDDVLDTWFSSWLVPFSSLGWPDREPDLARYYPGHTLVSAPEILFFWVARMIMSGLHFMGEVPYTRMYLHGTVRDTQHRKMSKSLGNGIDPLEVVERYGADALRYSLVSGMSVGTDVILDPQDLETSFGPGRNFANKLWNAGRFILSNLDGPPRPLAGRRTNVVRRDDLSAGRPVDHRALRGDGTRGDRGVRAVPPERGGGRRVPLHLERPRRLVHRADQAPALRRRTRRRCGSGGRCPDVRRRATPPAPGDAVRHGSALEAVSRPR